MNLTVTLLLVVFFGIFHAFGGASLGSGIRVLRENSPQARFLLIFGAVFGLVPHLFDYFF